MLPNATNQPKSTFELCYTCYQGPLDHQQWLLEIKTVLSWIINYQSTGTLMVLGHKAEVLRNSDLALDLYHLTKFYII